jgi:hypothetical protein
MALPQEQVDRTGCGYSERFAILDRFRVDEASKESLLAEKTSNRKVWVNRILRVGKSLTCWRGDLTGGLELLRAQGHWFGSAIWLGLGGGPPAR